MRNSRDSRTDRTVCHVVRSWPDHKRAICECGWEGYAHVLTWFAAREAREHCARTGCRVGRVVNRRVE